MKNNEQNNEIHHNNKNCRKNFTQQHRATIQRAIPVEKHNHPYQIEKIDVPQHQP